MNKKIVYTKGNVTVNDIKIGDIHYEYDWGIGIKVEVIAIPTSSIDKEGRIKWTWKSKQVSTGKIIDYIVTEGLAHYGPNLYTYEAYQVNHIL